MFFDPASLTPANLASSANFESGIPLDSQDSQDSQEPKIAKPESPPDLSPGDEEEAIAEAIEERAAVREFDGGETREVAERNARSAMRVFRYRLTDKPRSWLVLIAPGCDLAEARRHLVLRFGDRVLAVIEHRPGRLSV
jgi:hypothetical protein